MESRAAFLEKLNGLVEVARKNGNCITVAEVKEYFITIDFAKILV